MKKPYYFDADAVDRGDDGPNDEGLQCYPLSRHRDELDPGTERRLYRARPMCGTGDYYCTEYGFHGNTKQPPTEYDTCGKGCDLYEPCNGRSGRCRHARAVYEPTSEVIVLRADGTLIPGNP